MVVSGEPLPPMPISERMAYYKVPGLSVAVINDNKVVWARGYGTLAAGGTRQVTPTTLFQAASISKPVSAAGALTLVHRGQLSLDAPANQYLRSWRIPDTQLTLKRPVTLRHLLSHTAGTTVSGFIGYDPGEPLPTIRQILDGVPPANTEAVRVDQEPGAAWRYSGGGYMIVQQLMEDVTRKRFAASMKSLMKRWGMGRSTFVQPLPGSLHAIAAEAHLTDGSPLRGNGDVPELRGGRTPFPAPWTAKPEQAAAGLWTTPSDLAQFAIWIMRGASDATVPNEQRAVARLMLQPQTSKAAGGASFGMGVWLSSSGPPLRFWHGGSVYGMQSYLLAFPETGQGAVIMANGDGGYPLIQEMLRAIAEEYDWPERLHRTATIRAVDPRLLQLLTGSYCWEPSKCASVRVAERALEIQFPNRPWTRLRSESDTRFVNVEGGSRFIFNRSERGEASLTLDQIGAAPLLLTRAQAR